MSAEYGDLSGLKFLCRWQNALWWHFLKLLSSTASEVWLEMMRKIMKFSKCHDLAIIDAAIIPSAAGDTC